ncbi:Mlh1-like protein [Giardia lamblia P15]|uniref:Mlh1-like protein n=1 Tax=Giardia intestinalis (strain P15) TaxID=658858 RepID=E1EW08_GIAIA|nr:Mlh1-like protein [Giardia lamblia P15]
MPPIRILDSETVAKMAAGEVIQRPFNVAKELIENATDADAPTIRLFISSNCYDLLMVCDTGHGIERIDYSLLCHRFATSKIATFSDIYNIQSFGFRGEALSSISYISRMIIISKTRDQPTYLAVYMDGKLHFDPKILATEHTDFFINTLKSDSFTIVCVTDLFYTEPIRRNQIRSSKTSLDMQELLISISAANPTREYSISFINNLQAIQREIQSWLNDTQHISGILSLISHTIEFGTATLHFSSTTTRYQRFLQVLTTLLNQTKGCGVEAPHIHSLVKSYPCNTCRELSFYFVEPIDHSRQDKRLINLLIFINSRRVQYPRLKNAVQSVVDIYLSAFSTIQAGILWIAVDPGGCDPNVHPSKERVLLLEEEAIYTAVIDMLTQHMKEHYVKTTEPLLSQPKLKLRPQLTHTDNSIHKGCHLTNALDSSFKGTSNPLYKQRHDPSTISIFRFEGVQRTPREREPPTIQASILCSPPPQFPHHGNSHDQEGEERQVDTNKESKEDQSADISDTTTIDSAAIVQQVQEIQAQSAEPVNYMALFDKEFGEHSRKSPRVLASMNVQRLIDSLPAAYNPNTLPALNRDTKLILCGATTMFSSEGVNMLLGFLQSKELALICVDMGKLLVAKMLSCYYNLLSSQYLSHDIFYRVSNLEVHSRKLAELLSDYMFGISNGTLVLAPHILVLLVQSDQNYKEILETIKRWDLLPSKNSLENFVKEINIDFCYTLAKSYIELLVNIIMDRIGQHPSELCQFLQALSPTLLGDNEWRCYALTGYSAREVLQSFNRVV